MTLIVNTEHLKTFIYKNIVFFFIFQISYLLTQYYPMVGLVNFFFVVKRLSRNYNSFIMMIAIITIFTSIQRPP